MFLYAIVVTLLATVCNTITMKSTKLQTLGTGHATYIKQGSEDTMHYLQLMANTCKSSSGQY